MLVLSHCTLVAFCCLNKKHEQYRTFYMQACSMYYNCKLSSNGKLFLIIVPIETIASFRRMKKLIQDLSVIAAALRTSPKLVIFCFSFCFSNLKCRMFVSNSCTADMSWLYIFETEFSLMLFQVVSPDGKRVRRFGPLPQNELKDSKVNS